VDSKRIVSLNFSGGYEVQVKRKQICLVILYISVSELPFLENVMLLQFLYPNYRRFCVHIVSLKVIVWIDCSNRENLLGGDSVLDNISSKWVYIHMSILNGIV